MTSVNDLVLGLDKERFNVIFVYLSSDGVGRNLKEGVGYEVFYLCNSKRIRTFCSSILLRLIRVLKKHNINIIHCHGHKSTVYGTIAAIFAHTPVVIAHVHGLGRTRNFRRRLMNLLLFRRINKIVPVAVSVKEDVLKNNWFLSENKFFVLENSVDYERFAKVSISKEDAKRLLGTPSDAFVFGTAGRLAPTKGLSYLIEAFAKVKEQEPSAHLVLLGDGPSRAELEQQASKMSCCNSIHFLGHRDNIEQLVRGMDVFVLSSVAEGMPRVLLEAMAAGIPCIATKVGGIPEIINGQDVDLLVPPRDENALAKAMITLSNAPEQKLKGFIERARERIRTKFNHHVVMKKLENTYEMEVGRYYKSIKDKRITCDSDCRNQV